MRTKEDIERKIGLLTTKIERENEKIQQSQEKIKNFNKEIENLLQQKRHIEALEVLELLKESGMKAEDLKELLRK